MIIFRCDLFFSCLFCFSSFSLSKQYCAKSILGWASAVATAAHEEISDTATKTSEVFAFFPSSSHICNDISGPLALEVCFNYITNTPESLLRKGLKEQLRVWARQLVANLETPRCYSNGPVGRACCHVPVKQSPRGEAATVIRTICV